MSPTEMAAITRALADPRRYSVVTELAAADTPLQCASLAQASCVSASTMTHHLQMLEQAGLIEIARDGRFAILRFMRERFESYLRQLAADTTPRA